jgi:hypothetical protein
MQEAYPDTYVISSPLVLLLMENHDFTVRDCGDIPDCNCGHLHLIPSPKMLLGSEFLEESEADEFERRIEQGSENQENLALEILDLMEARAFYDAAALRAEVGMSLDEDPPSDLFNA